MLVVDLPYSVRLCAFVAAWLSLNGAQRNAACDSGCVENVMQGTSGRRPKSSVG